MTRLRWPTDEYSAITKTPMGQRQQEVALIRPVVCGSRTDQNAGTRRSAAPNSTRSRPALKRADARDAVPGVVQRHQAVHADAETVRPLAVVVDHRLKAPSRSMPRCSGPG
jgi:hypothetical protein